MQHPKGQTNDTNYSLKSAELPFCHQIVRVSVCECECELANVCLPCLATTLTTAAKQSSPELSKMCTWVTRKMV